MTKELHYLCKSCAEAKFEAGGYAAATLHHKKYHMGERFDPEMVMMYPRRTE